MLYARWLEPPQVVVFSGTRGAENHVPYIRQQIADLGRRLVPSKTVFVTGGQVGTDYVALRACVELYPAAHHSLWLPARRHSGVDAWLRTEGWQHIKAHDGSYQVHDCLPGTSYVYRDQCMLQEAYDYMGLGSYVQLVAFPLLPEDHPRMVRSGTWKTVRLARAARLPVVVHKLWSVRP